MSPPSDPVNSVEVFISYSHEDEKFLAMLNTHLASLRRLKTIRTWTDQMILGGSEWKKEIARRLGSADVILLLVSPDFLASDFCYLIEMERAIERHKNGLACVIPIILRAVDDWQSTPLGELQVLPQGGKPVTSSSWSNLDEAFADVARGVRLAVKELISRKTTVGASVPKT